MSNLIQLVISFLLVFPIALFIIVYLISIKIQRKSSRAFGLAADITTMGLFFSIPIALQSLFQIETRGSILGIALLVSLIFTILEWKTQNEIQLFPLLRRIWRFLFLVLSLVYIVIWCMGLVLKVTEFLK